MPVNATPEETPPGFTDDNYGEDLTPEETPTPEVELVGQLDVSIPLGGHDTLTAIAAEMVTAHNEGLRRGYDVEHVTFQGLSVSTTHASLVFTAAIIGTPEGHDLANGRREFLVDGAVYRPEPLVETCDSSDPTPEVDPITAADDEQEARDRTFSLGPDEDPEETTAPLDGEL